MKKTYLALIASASLAALTVQAQVIANFTDGTGTSSVDQYAGKSGSGWAAGWVTSAPGDSGNFTASVQNTSQLKSGGNYLSATLTTTATRLGAVSRDYTTNGTFTSLTSPYVIRFDYRLDSWSNLDNSSDFIDIFDRNTVGQGFGGDATWGIRAYGANTGTALANKWSFYNGGKDGASFNTSLYVSSTMSVVVGTTYSFSIAVDPVAKTYIVTIDNGTTSISSSAMGFRTAGTASTLNFGAQTTGATDSMTFSVDNISIGVAAIPEPATAGLLIGAAAMFLTAFGRRRFRSCKSAS